MKKITLSFTFFLITFLALFINSNSYANVVRNEGISTSIWASKSYSPQLNLQPYFDFLTIGNSNFYYFDESSNLIYDEDFEGAHGWVFVNHSINKWVVGSAVSNGTGTKSLYISDDEGVTNKYAFSSSQVSHAYKQIAIPEGTGDIAVTFDWRCYGEGFSGTAYDYFKVWLVAETVTPVEGVAITAGATKILLRNAVFNNKPTFVTENLTVNAAVFAGQNARLVFEWSNDSSGGNPPPAAVDNLNVTAIACSAPAGLNVTAATTTTLTIGWTAGAATVAGYDVYYATTNTAPTATTTPSFTSVTGLTQVIPELTANTAYYVWVRSTCGEDGNSFWSGPLNAQTPCASISTLPFTETFASTSTTKACWTVIDGNNDGDKWDLNYSSNTFVGNQVANMYTDGNGGNNDDWLISPTITLTGNQRLKYHYRVQSAGEPNDFRVMLSTTGGQPVNFTHEIVAFASYSNIAYVEKIVNLIDANGVPYSGDVNIAWHVPEDGLDGWRLYIDNVIVEDIPSCPDPSGITVSDISQTEAAIAWTAGLNETAWEVSVAPNGTGVPTGDGTAVTSATYTPNDLNHSTQYEVYVRAVCAEDDKSNWVGPLAFTTTQIPQTLPYNENFEGSVGFTFNNETINKWVVGTAVSNGTGTKSMYVSKDNGTTYEYNKDLATVSHAYRDLEIPAGTNEISVSFDWKCVGETTSWDRFRVWLVPLTFNPAVGVQITESAAQQRIQIGRENYNGNNVFLRENIVANVAAFAGQNVRLVFEWRNDGSGGSQPPAAIDNLNVTVITCSAPSNLHTTDVSQNTISASWEAPNGSAPEGYDILFSTTTDAPDAGSTPTHTAVETNIEFDELTPSTVYYIWVRSNCGTVDGTSFWIGPLKVTTAQVPATLPFMEDFEGTDNWTTVGTGNNEWVIGTAVNNGGNKSLYVSKNSGTTHEYDTNVSAVSHAYRDFVINDVSGEMSISFDWICNGEGFFGTKWDYFNVWILPSSYGVTPGTLIENTIHGGYRIVEKFNNNEDDFLTEEVVFNLNNLYQGFANGNFRIVFEWRNDSGGNQPPAAIDNLDIRKLSCPTAIDLYSEVIEGTGNVLLSWTPTGDETQWEVFIVLLEEDGPTNASTGIIVDEPQFLYEEGDEEEFYKFYVRPLCSAEDVGRWSDPGIISFIKPPGCAEINVDLDMGDVNLVQNEQGNYVICQDEPVELTLDATYYNIPSTTEYEVESIEYRPPFPFVGGGAIQLTADDAWSDVIDLGFDFCFYGNKYNNVLISTNGIITFSINGLVEGGRYSAGTGNTIYYPGQEIPYAPAGNSGSSPTVNSIFGVFQDLDPSGGASPDDYSINYQIIGKAPCRTLVFNMYHMGLFSCDYDPEDIEGSTQTSQIVLYEGTNIIEVYVKNRPMCMSWGDGKGLIGIQNADGTDGLAAPGRNSGAWTATEEAWRFSPSGESSVDFVWEKDGEFFSNDQTINISIDETVSYVAKAVYQACGTEFIVHKDFNFIKENFDIQQPEDIIDCNRKPGELNVFDLRSSDETVLGDLDPSRYSIEYFSDMESLEAGTDALPDTFETDASGTVFVKLTNNNTQCYKVKSFKLIIAPPVEVTKSDDFSVCESYTFPVIEEGEAYYTKPYGEGDKYEGGAVFSEIGTHTIYIYKVSDVGCYGQSEFKLEIVNPPVADIISDQLLQCETFYLPTPSEHNKYYTEAGGKGFEILPGTEIILPSTIYIYAKIEGDDGAVCVDESSFRIDYEDCPIQKGLSPNGDGLNDFFNLSGYGVSELKIYNRLGTEVFSFGMGYTNQWFGQDKSGKALPDGTYYYKVISNGKVRTGWVQINK